MRLEVSYLAAAAHLVVLSGAQSIPPCASTCASEAAAGLFGCVSSDLACSCNPPSSNQYLACIQEVCPPASVAEFKTWAEAECAKYITASGTSSTSSGSASSPNSASAVAVQSSSAGSSSGSSSGSGSGSGAGTSAGTVATVTATVTHSGAGIGSGEQKTGLAALLAIIAALV